MDNTLSIEEPYEIVIPRIFNALIPFGREGKKCKKCYKRSVRGKSNLCAPRGCADRTTQDL